MVSAGTMNVYIFAVFFSCIILGSFGCFIRNCPPGGKRGLDMNTVDSRECMSCGPEGRGQCVGPNICCGTDFGCYFGTSEASVCQKENESLTPCKIRGPVCGSRGQGNCVADGTCCDSEACSLNSKCDIVDKRPPTSKGELLQLVQKLLRSKNYD